MDYGRMVRHVKSPPTLYKALITGPHSTPTVSGGAASCGQLTSSPQCSTWQVAGKYQSCQSPSHHQPSRYYHPPCHHPCTNATIPIGHHTPQTKAEANSPPIILSSHALHQPGYFNLSASALCAIYKSVFLPLIDTPCDWGWWYMGCAWVYSVNLGLPL